MVEVTCSPDLMKKIGFGFCSSVSDAGYDNVTPKSSSDSR